MNRILTFTVVFVNILFNASCKQNIDYDCPQKYNIEIRQYVDSLVSINASNEESRKDILDFEHSIGSTILFCADSKDTSLFNAFKDSLLNEKDIDYREGLNGTDHCRSCFLGPDNHTYIVALRPQIHPFIKEIAIYGDEDYPNGLTYRTYYYYQNRTLDKLIPQTILAQYHKDTFNIDKFWCFRDQLLDALDKYHDVGEHITRSYDENVKPKGKKERYIYKKGRNFISDITRENFTGTEQDYKWIKKNENKMETYSWYTARYQPFENKLYTNTFWYNSDLYTKDEGVSINAGSISSPKDIYIELDLTYRKDYVDKIIYK